MVSLLEVLHSADLGLDDWAKEIVSAARPVLSEGLGVSLRCGCLSTGREILDCSQSDDGTSYGHAYDVFRATAKRTLPHEDFEALYPDHKRVALLTEQRRTLSRTVSSKRSGDGEFLEGGLQALKSMGAVDVLGLVSRPTATVGLALIVPQRERRGLRRSELERLTELSLHLEAAVRVRLDENLVLGSITPEGRFDLAGDLPRSTRRTLGHKVRQIEQLRTQRRRHDGEAALDLWQALVSGSLLLVERVERGGQRRYLICESPPRRRTIRGLTRPEVTVSIQAARGLTNKAVAYSLGWGEAATARRLSRAATKLGLPSSRALVRLLVGLGVAGGSTVGLDLRGLSAVERQVAGLLGEGLTNEQIAARRGVAVRTVANQVASLLRKTGAEGRRAFAGLSAGSSGGGRT